MSNGYFVYRSLLARLKAAGQPCRVHGGLDCAGIYKRERGMFWRAVLEEDDAYTGPGCRFTLQVDIKPLVYDDVRFAVTLPGETIPYSGLLRAKHGFAFYTFCRQAYLVRDEEADNETRLREIAAQMFDDISEALAELRKEAGTTVGAWHRFILRQQDREPMLAGLSFLALKQYDEAARCFLQAERDDRIWYARYGKDDRYFHHVCMDFCTVMSRGESWEKEYVTEGLPEA